MPELVDAQFRSGEINDLLATPEPCAPNRFAPTVNHGIALRARTGGEHIRDPDRTSLYWERWLDPILATAGQLHVRFLGLLAGEALLEAQIEPDQCEHNVNRLRRFVGVLGSKGVNRVLMDECRIGMGECVEGEFVEEFLSGFHRGASFGSNSFVSSGMDCVVARGLSVRQGRIVFGELSAANSKALGELSPDSASC